MKKNLTPIASAVAMLMLSVSAQAQQADTSQTAAPTAPAVEQVIVTGVRASLQQSLTQKRDSESIVEVITAEDIGKMPDKNVADSLSRVAGVTTTSAGAAEGSFGENEHVQLRGLAAQYTLTTLNGHSVSSGDWYSVNMAEGSRSVSYTLLPSDIVGEIVVHKSSQADLIEGGMAGTVDIDTRKPLSYPDKLTVVANGEADYGSAAKKVDPNLSALMNWKNDDNTFGITAQVFYQKRDLMRAGSEGVWWNAAPANQAIPALNGTQVSYLSGAVLFQQTRTREGGYLEAEWKPRNDMAFGLSFFDSSLEAANYNTNYMADTINTFSGTKANGNTPVAPSSYTLNGNTVTAANFAPNAFGGNNTGAYSVIEDVAIRPDAKTYSRFLNVDGKWVVDKDLTLTSKLGRTEGGGKTTDVGFEVGSGYVGVGYSQASNGIFQLNVPNGGTFVPNGYGIGGWGDYNVSADSENYGQVDGKWKLNSEMVPSLQFGLRATQHERSQNVTDVSTAAAGTASDSIIPASAIGNYPSGYYGNLPTNPTPGYLPFKISNSYVESWLGQYGTFNKPSAQSSFNIKESTEAGYFMANLAPTDKITGNVGIRIVGTSEDIFAYLPGGAPEYKDSFTDVLPSLNLRFDLAPSLVGRVALNRGMSRPDFGQLAGISISDLQQTGVGSNPNLAPVRSNNLDGTLEWYFAPKSVLALNVFASDLQGVISYGKSTVNYTDQSAGGVIKPYVMSTPANVDGKLSGVDLAYQQGFALGFGVLANYTYTDGRQTTQMATGTCNGTATQDCSLYGTSKNAYNVGVYFENDKFSTNLSYTYRNTYKLANSGGVDYFQSGNGSLNLSANYTYSKNLTFTFSGQNLTDPLLTTYQTNTTEIHGVYKNGMMLYAGARVKF
ncbi:TonB-dependent receptor [Solimicrobium silvestre]|uniref:TonB-Xanth-Caul: TonB-dependent receptor n=1 Tax=Solimicrobium silvestre TaxID=2099400 RepID=A0A2S9H3F7_9BURK|nr:TonB-dependent receptor [Solimicrobium silvestre]PRC94500.1 TonB-Xanth-Caul: TonB-dependent receptor [Solimicrobium silvestre]